MRKHSYLFAMAGIALAIPTVAFLPRVAECQQEKHILTQPELNIEAEKDWHKADAEMNRVYQKLLSQLDATGTAKLKKAQRAWIAYRDAEAESSGDEMRGGQAEIMLLYGTKARLTKERTTLLKTKLDLRQ